MASKRKKETQPLGASTSTAATSTAEANANAATKTTAETPSLATESLQTTATSSNDTADTQHVEQAIKMASTVTPEEAEPAQPAEQSHSLPAVVATSQNVQLAAPTSESSTASASSTRSKSTAGKSTQVTEAVQIASKGTAMGTKKTHERSSRAPTPQAISQADGNTHSKATTSPSTTAGSKHSLLTSNTETIESTLAEPPPSPQPVQMVNRCTMADNFSMEEEIRELRDEVNRLKPLQKELMSIKSKHGHAMAQKIKELEDEHETSYKAREKLDEVKAQLHKSRRVCRDLGADLKKAKKDQENADGRAKSQAMCAREFEVQLFTALDRNGSLLDRIQELESNVLDARAEMQAEINTLRAEAQDQAASSTPDAEELASKNRRLQLAKDIIKGMKQEIDKLTGELEEAKAAPEQLKTERTNFERERYQMRNEIRRLREELGRKAEPTPYNKNKNNNAGGWRR